jgi:cysteine desulfurase
MNADAVYCDYNAGAPVRPAAAEAFAAALSEGGNPSSVHGPGRRAKARLEAARETLAEHVAARASDVIFASGATEALHLALEAAKGGAGNLYYSAIEHDALAEQAPISWPGATALPVGSDGVLDLQAAAAMLARAERPRVACMLANNETGVVQPIAQLALLVRQAGGLLLVDAAQALGRMQLDLAALDASYLIVSSHKVGGPPGLGALILAPGAPLAQWRRGGGQERGFRPGTENVPAAHGFAAALSADFAAETQHARKLRDAFESELKRRHPDATVFGERAARLANTSLFALPGLRAETALIALDLDGVCVSSGAACSSGKVRQSRVLQAMGVSAELSRAALRASFGWASRAQDVERLLTSLDRVCARARSGAR